MSQGNLEGLLNCSLEKLKGLVDVNTIIGQPITAPDGTIIVPCQKWRLATAPEAAILAGISRKICSAAVPERAFLFSLWLFW